MRHSRLLSALLLALVASLVPAPPAQAGRPPVDYSQMEGLSQPSYEVLHEVVRLPMRDGVHIYLEIVRPSAPGRYPVILEASPYHGTLADRDGTRIFPDPHDAQGRPLGLTGYFGPRGYAVVMMDLRGTGRSDGCLDHMGPEDAMDLVEVIEWAADAPWSSGRVGMTGHSYVGSTPVIAAAQRPRGLVTIVPSAGIARAYDHQFQHGVAYAGQWAGLPLAYNLIAMDRHLPVGVYSRGGDNFGNGMQYFGCGWTTSSLQEGHRQLTGEYSGYHAARDHSAGATAAPIPIFLVQGVYDRAVRPPAMDWFNRRRNPGDKLWYGQFDHGINVHPNRRGEQWQYALHAWFDKHLPFRDVDTGPPVEVFMNGRRSRNRAISAHEHVYTADAWPGQPQMLELHLDADGRALRSTQSTMPDGVTFAGGRLAPGIEFRSDPVSSDLLLVGLPEFELVVSVTSQHLDLIANVYDEAPDGSRRELSQAAIDPALRYGISDPAPIVPGKAYTLRPPAWPMAHRLRAGHRIVLRVATTDRDKFGFHTEDPAITVHTGHLGSVIRLPVAQGTLYRDPLAP